LLPLPLAILSLLLQPLLRLLRRDHPSPASSRQAGQLCCGVRGMFREQSWKCCLWVTVNRCKPNFRGSGVYVPRSIDWHPA
jgi:hypothetical protein